MHGGPRQHVGAERLVSATSASLRFCDQNANIDLNGHGYYRQFQATGTLHSHGQGAHLRGLGLLATFGESLKLAGELHTLGGEAAMLSLPEVAREAWEGERVAQLLGTGSDREARVTCGRLLRKLSYLVQRLSANWRQCPRSRWRLSVDVA